MELVLASQNAKKLAELEALLAPLNWRVRSLAEFTDQGAPEDAPSFIENALAKARYAAEVTGLPAIADDSGLEVAALSGAPGVHSARYAGVQGDDAANNAKLLEALQGTSRDQRGARFVCVLALLRHPQDPTPIIAEGYWAGEILSEAQGEGGFGYNPLFWVPSEHSSAAQLAPARKRELSHRGQAMQCLIQKLQAAA